MVGSPFKYLPFPSIPVLSDICGLRQQLAVFKQDACRGYLLSQPLIPCILSVDLVVVIRDAER